MHRPAEPLTASLVRSPGIAMVLAMLIPLCRRLLVDRGRRLLRHSGVDPAPPAALSCGLPVGAFLSDFALPDRDGGIVTLADLIAPRLLLLFVQPDCRFSRALARALEGDAANPDAPRQAFIVSGDANDPRRLAPFAAAPGPVLIDPHGQVARLMDVTATPTGYLVDERRRTVLPRLEGPAVLLNAARGRAPVATSNVPPAITPLPFTSSLPSPLPTGVRAPAFTLPLLTGGEWSLQEHQGQSLALVFSDPACPPCVTLLHELARRDVAGVVVVSRGDIGENARLATGSGLSAPLLVQRNREIARAYGVLETPAVYVIDPTGVIAAGPGIGAEEVLALIARKDRPRSLAKWARAAVAAGAKA